MLQKYTARVVLTANTKSKEEMEEKTMPKKVKDTDKKQPAKVDFDFKDIVSENDEEDEMDSSDEQMHHPIKKVQKEDTKDDNHNAHEREKKEGMKNEVSMEDFEIEKIMHHKISKKHRNRYVKAFEQFYRMRWYGCETEEEKCSQTQYIARGKILSYYRKKTFAIPDSIDQADDG